MGLTHVNVAHIVIGRHATENAAVHQAFPTHRIGWRQIDVRSLLEESDLQMELLGYTLWWSMRVARPDDITNVQLLRFGP